MLFTLRDLQYLLILLSHFSSSYNVATNQNTKENSLYVNKPIWA